MGYRKQKAPLTVVWIVFGDVMTVDHVIEGLSAAASGVAA
jgi:hypothetical protein